MDWLAWRKSKSADNGESEQINQEQKTTTSTDTSTLKKTISGPYTSDNLTIFFFHGSEKEKTRQFITLEEALARKDVVVGETGTVQELKIKNKGKEYVFVQSGDIVKGGKQDRAIQHDMILDPHCEFIPISSFCVEQGRWRQRGNENMTEFSESSHHLSSKSLKMAAKYAGSQSEVWSEVSKMQSLTADSTGVPLSDLQDEQSPTSLHLTLDHVALKDATDRYLNDLQSLIEEHEDIVGFAFAINGELNSADVYRCHDLFGKMWPRLLKAAALEALSQSAEKKEAVQPTREQIEAFLAKAEQAQGTQKATSGKSRIILKESGGAVLFETCDISNGDSWVHRNYVSTT